MQLLASQWNDRTRKENMPVKQQLKWLPETNECLLITQLNENTIKVESLTPKQASQWQAENKF
jgi:hypothetical protein